MLGVQEPTRLLVLGAWPPPAGAGPCYYPYAKVISSARKDLGYSYTGCARGCGSSCHLRSRTAVVLLGLTLAGPLYMARGMLACLGFRV